MDQPLTLAQHLSELRKRLLIALVALTAATGISFSFSADALRVLKMPAYGLIGKLAVFSPQEAFLVYMRIAFLCGFTISLPVILHQAWKFIAPALEERFRNGAAHFVGFCFLAFILGCCFAYFVLIPPALKFLLSFAEGELVPVISAAQYIGFIVTLIFGCGLVFEMPVLSFILARLRVLKPSFLRSKYKYAVAAIFVAAAVITPTADIFNMTLLAIPMILLYEISIWVAKLA
ncbi:MAG: twin-arginine translocase subunit TatC [Candidatus Omnitrophica bacterium]|nr:twin-arginine translocase subunit TatC [Candidatus Omnitrophota bacterium]